MLFSIVITYSVALLQKPKFLKGRDLRMLRLITIFLLLAIFNPSPLFAEEEGGFFSREALLKGQKENETYDYQKETGGDFFMVDEERMRRQNERDADEADKDPNIQKSLKILNQIRGKDEEAERNRDQWGEFENVAGGKAEKAFLNSTEVEVWRELQKPAPRKRAFDNKIDDLEEAVNSLRAPNISGKNPK